MTKTLQALIQDFFTQHLVVERNLSPNTVAAYRDAMKLFLLYASQQTGSSPDQLGWAVFDVNNIRSFLSWLAKERGCKPPTRNQRLAALKSFARYVAFVAPEHLERCRLVRELLPAKCEQANIQYLEEEEVVQLMASPDTATPAGRRDLALMLLLYNTGARVQEIADLNIQDIQEKPIAFVRIQGKGRKQRTCPVWSRTVHAIQRMLDDRPGRQDTQPLFVSSRGFRISRSGITYLLRRSQKKICLEPVHTKKLSPHVIRHTTAMHLLQSGVDITTIAAWLGHAQLATTHAYVEIDLRMKQAVIAAESVLPEIKEGAYPNPDIIDWLENMTRNPNYVQQKNSTDRKDELISSDCT